MCSALLLSPSDGILEITEVVLKVCARIFDGVTTSASDEFAAETAAIIATLPASRIAVSDIHKNTKESTRAYISPYTKHAASFMYEYVHDFVLANREKLDASVVCDRDFSYDYFGFKTLERSYLLRINGKIVERPQHVLMRYSLWLCGSCVDNVRSFVVQVVHSRLNNVVQRWYLSTAAFGVLLAHRQRRIH